MGDIIRLEPRIWSASPFPFTLCGEERILETHAGCRGLQSTHKQTHQNNIHEENHRRSSIHHRPQIHIQPTHKHNSKYVNQSVFPVQGKFLDIQRNMNLFLTRMSLQTFLVHLQNIFNFFSLFCSPKFQASKRAKSHHKSNTNESNDLIQVFRKENVQKLKNILMCSEDEQKTCGFETT